MSRVRTNIEIEDTYLQVVMDRYGLRTKTDAVEFALRHLAGQPMTREEALTCAVFCCGSACTISMQPPTSTAPCASTAGAGRPASPLGA